MEVHVEIGSDPELIDWLVEVSKTVLFPTPDTYLEGMVRGTVWRQAQEMGFEWACPEHPQSRRLLQKIDLRDSSHSTARFILVDELLFRGKVSCGSWSVTFVSL
jgi:hypothetical protein